MFLGFEDAHVVTGETEASKSPFGSWGVVLGYQETRNSFGKRKDEQLVLVQVLTRLCATSAGSKAFIAYQLNPKQRPQNPKDLEVRTCLFCWLWNMWCLLSVWVFELVIISLEYLELRFLCLLPKGRVQRRIETKAHWCIDPSRLRTWCLTVAGAMMSVRGDRLIQYEAWQHHAFDLTLLGF